MTCPSCQSRMNQRAIAGILIDSCASCGGVWFDADELGRYRTKLGKPRKPPYVRFEAKEDQEPKGCPRCRVRTLLYGERAKRRMLRCSNCHGFFLTKSALESLGAMRKEETEEGVLDADLQGVVEKVADLFASLFD